MSNSPSLSAQRIEGKYEILEKISEGGMGAIYKVRHRLLDEIRVVKLMRPQLVEDEDLRERFLREARIAIQVRHPNIAQLYDFTVDDDGFAFIVMEYIQGKTLEEILRSSGPPSIDLALEIAHQSLSALDYLHGKGFVHHDIAPDNLMLSEDLSGNLQIKLIDLGIAKNLDGTGTTVTQTGTFLGKLRYSSPEQFRGDSSVDSRGDIYSFGIVLYELLTGIHPIVGTDPSSLIAGHLFRPPIPFSESDPQGRVPHALRAAVLKALAKAPEERFASAEELREELDPYRLSGDGRLAEARKLLHAEPEIRSVARQSNESGPGTNRETTRIGDAFAIISAPPSGAKPTTTVVPVRERVPLGSVGGDSTSAARLSSVASLPRQIRRFTLHELIARGRSGDLYKAFDPVRGGLFGLKVVPIEDETASERLLRGGRIWLGLAHPNLLRVLEVHPPEKGEPAVIVTELVDGVDLATLMPERTLTLEAKLEVTRQLSEALAYLHDQGFLHREVKPRNVLISRGPRALLLDSGIARPANPDLESLTSTGMIVGDLRYMAPEQLCGKPEMRSDIFSLGALIYELLLGEQPRLDDRTELFARLHRDLSLPQRLIEVVEKCLAESPDERYASAHDLADSLRGFLAGAPPRSRAQRQVVALHGIRTYAGWQRTFSEVADDASWRCRSDRWNFGYFSVVRFLQPWSRSAKVEWFRRTYRDEFNLGADSGAELPSIVAHSFGTYILGNALLRYPYLRFNKVILCGSILPIDFPWATLLDSGQVQSVRNEYGASDYWSGLVEHFVPGTGASGRLGFLSGHRRLEQERFEFSHSEYFERSHMEGRWIPFLSRAEAFVAPRERSEPVQAPGERPARGRPIFGVEAPAREE